MRMPVDEGGVSHATMRQDTVVRFRKKDEVVDQLTELLRSGVLAA
jgi:hypothetical protein